MANHKNLASVVLEYGGTTSQSSIVMSDADAAVFPSAPFYATIMPSGELANNTNSEIIEVTSSSTLSGNTTFIISRAQRGTSAISWSAGEAIMVNGIYVEDAIFEGATLSTPSNVAYVAEANIQSNAVTTSKIADGSVTSDKIDYTTLPFTPTSISVTKESTNIGAEGYKWCIKYDKMVIYNLNFQISTATSSANVILYSGFPIPKLPDGTTTRAVFMMGNGSDNKAYRGFINQSGQLISDGVLATGWYNGQVIYFTS